MKVTAGQLEYGFGKCGKCLRLSPLSDFRQWEKEGEKHRARTCKRCEAPASERIQVQPGIVAVNVYNRRGKAYYNKQVIIQNAKDRPCHDCGRRFPAVCMEFDHLPEHGKEYNVAAMMNHSMALILAEIAKCEIVCACCHRIRSARRGWKGGRKKAAKAVSALPAPACNT